MTPSPVRALITLLALTSTAVAQPDDGEDENASVDESASAGDTDAPVEDQNASIDGKNASEAGENASESDTNASAEEDPDHGHMMQFGLRAGIVLGYRMFFRYDESPFCTEPFTDEPDPEKQQSICGFGAPPATELALSFAPLDSIEPYIFARLGFSGEDETNTEALRMFGAGARIYTMSDSAFKLFVEPALAYQFEGSAGDPSYCSEDSREARCGSVTTEYKKDLVFHLGIGPQYDFARYFGVYLNAGMDVGIFRAIHATLLGHLGVQGRFP